MTKQPLVIGVGGLLEQGETGRIQEMLQLMKEKGCVVYAPRFSSICRDGDTILCPVNGGWVEDIARAFREALSDERVDTNRIGIIGSSLGTTYIDQFLAQTDLRTSEPIPYTALVPFARPHEGVKPYIQKMIDGKVDLDVSFPHDRENGRTRVIPSNCLQNVLDIDVPKTLRESGRVYNVKPLTILGLKDDRADNGASKERHKILGGSVETLLELDYGHVIPQEVIQERILDFMYEGLGIKQ